jgi:hypothetical protein
MLQTWLQTLAALAAAHNPGVSRWTWAAAVLAAGFAAAAVGGRAIALLARVALVVAGVLIAARIAGVGI